MHTTDVNSLIRNSESFPTCFQQLVKDLLACGKAQLVARCIKAISLIRSWNQNESTCFAAALSLLLIQDDTGHDSSIGEFERAIGERSRQLAIAVAKLTPSLSSTTKLAVDSTVLTHHQDICNIIAALALVTHESSDPSTMEQLNNLFRIVSGGVCQAAYDFYLSSNVLLALPADAHQSALRQACERVRESRPTVAPCPHAFTTHAFPQPYHEAMVRLLPSLSRFQQIPNATLYEKLCKHALGISGNRYHLWLRDLLKVGEHSRNIDLDLQTHFWRSASECLTSSPFITALHDTFLPNSRPEYDVAIRLVKEVGSVYLAPHLDMPNKPLTLLLYIAGNEDATTQGTSLYDFNKAAPETLRLSKTLPFSHNSFLILPRTTESFHGVEAHRLSRPRTTLHLYLQHR
jgi:hypothetical protein